MMDDAASRPPGPARHDVVGVFANSTVAQAVARRVVDLGVSPSSVRVDDAGARVESIRAEMREEADNTIVGPGSVGPFTREMTRGIAAYVVLGVVAGAILALPLGLISIGSLGLGVRLAIAAALGAVTGATIGFELGGGLGAKGPAEPLAAERGVAVSVGVEDSLAATVVRIMREAQPIRLDLGTIEGNPVDTITTEADSAAARRS